MFASIAKKAHRSLVEAALGAVWVQWRAVGGMVSADRPAHSTIDAEALVFASLALMPHERRLADVLRDWIVRNSHLLSVQRFKNMARAFPASTSSPSVDIAAWAVREGKDFRWRRLASMAKAAHDRSDRSDHRVRKATTPDLRSPPAIMLRLRVGLGIGNKADVLSFLLGSGGRASTVREIATAIGYTVHALHRTVDDLTRAGLIHSTDDTPARYGVQNKRWQTLLEVERLTEWCYWDSVYSLVAEFDHWTRETRRRKVSEYAFGVRARELIAQHRDLFRRAGAGMADSVKGKPPLRDPVERFAVAVEELVGWIAGHA